MKKMAFAISIALALMLSRPAAQGATGASFLRLESDAASAAIGGAAVALGGSPFAAFHNPAGLAFLSGFEFAASHSQHIQSIGYQNLATSFGGRRLAVALSLRHLDLDGMEARTLPSAEPDSRFGSNALAPSFSLARRMGRCLSAGASLKLVYQKIATYQASSLAGDAGLIFHDGIPGLRVGLALSDWGGGVKFEQVSSSLPSRIDLGLSYSFLRRSLTLSAELDKTRSEPLFARLGSEYSYRDLLFLRAGYRGGRRQAGGMAGLAAGLGMRVRDYQIGYAITSLGELGLSHHFSLAFHPSLSQHSRTERAVASEMQRRAQITAETFYRQGQDQLLSGRPEEAAWSFDMALIWDPEHSHALRSLEEARRITAERKIEKYLASGLDHYQSGRMIEAITDFGRVLEIKPDHLVARQWLDRISESLGSSPAPGRSDSLNHIIAEYLKAGAVHLSTKDYDRAIDQWNKVLEIDPQNIAARSSIEQARSLKIRAASQALDRAEQLARQNKWPAAWIQIEKSLSWDPDNPQALNLRDQISQKLKEISLNHARAGIDLYNRGELNAAEAELKLSLSLDKGNQSAADYLAKIGAQRSRATAREIEVLYLKGIAAYTQEDYAQAVALWQRVIELDPGHANARRNLERAREKLRIIGQ